MHLKGIQKYSVWVGDSKQRVKPPDPGFDHGLVASVRMAFNMGQHRKSHGTVSQLYQPDKS